MTQWEINPAVNAGDARDMGLIPGLGRSAGVVNDNLLFVTMGSQRVRHD